MTASAICSMVYWHAMAALIESRSRWGDPTDTDDGKEDSDDDEEDVTVDDELAALSCSGCNRKGQASEFIY